MPGFVDGSSNIVLVTRDNCSSGMAAETFEDYFDLAVVAIRLGVMRGEYSGRLRLLLEKGNLDSFVKVHKDLTLRALIKKDDIKNLSEDNL